MTQTMQTHSDQKIDHILAAVRQVLARRGLAAVTISEIASAAGVSRGLLHYYFKNKDEMVTQALQSSVEIYKAQVAGFFENAASAAELAHALCSALRGILREDPDFFRLIFERWGVARRGPEMTGELTEYHQMFRSLLQTGMQRLLAKGIIRPRLPLDGIVVLLTGLVDGLGMQLVLEPDLAGDEQVWQTTEATVKALLEGSTLPA